VRLAVADALGVALLTVDALAVTLAVVEGRGLGDVEQLSVALRLRDAVAVMLALAPVEGVVVKLLVTELLPLAVMEAVGVLLGVGVPLGVGGVLRKRFRSRTTTAAGRAVPTPVLI
jgi:hypothetical protein